MLRCYTAPGNGCLRRWHSELRGKCRWLLQAKWLWRFECIVVFWPSTMLLCWMNMARGVNRNLRVKIVPDCRFWNKKLQFFIQDKRTLFPTVTSYFSHTYTSKLRCSMVAVLPHSSMAWKNSRENKENMKQKRELKRYKKYWYEKNWNRTPNIAFTLLWRASLDHPLLKMMNCNTKTICLWYGDPQEHKERQLCMLQSRWVRERFRYLYFVEGRQERIAKG